jgi:hypothetical protein
LKKKGNLPHLPGKVNRFSNGAVFPDMLLRIIVKNGVFSEKTMVFLH